MVLGLVAHASGQPVWRISEPRHGALPFGDTLPRHRSLIQHGKSPPSKDLLCAHETHPARQPYKVLYLFCKFDTGEAAEASFPRWALRLIKAERENCALLVNFRHLEDFPVKITIVTLIHCCCSRLHVHLVLALCLTKYFFHVERIVPGACH